MPFNPSLLFLANKLERTPGRIGIVRPDIGPLPIIDSFTRFGDWFEEVDRLSLSATVPDKLAERWTRVQSAYLVAWLSPDLLVAADLVSFTALEYAVMDRYGGLATPRPKYSPKKPFDRMQVSFATALDYMVTGDGLTDDDLPFVRQHGGSLVRLLIKDNPTRPSLPDIRNKLAHGEAIESGPTSGLLEMIRDLIDYAYRHWPEA